jgi:hypothetical protein
VGAKTRNLGTDHLAGFEYAYSFGDYGGLAIDFDGQHF